MYRSLYKYSTYLLYGICIGFGVACSDNDTEEKGANLPPDTSNIIDTAPKYTDTFQIARKLASMDSLLKKSTPAEKASISYHKALLYLTKKDTLKAIHAFEQVLYFDKNNFQAALRLAFLYAEQKHIKTIELTHKVLQKTKENAFKAQAYFIEGIYYRNRKESEKAILSWNKTIANDWTFLDAYLEKGAILFHAQKFSEAKKVFQLAVKVNNHNPEVYYWLGLIYDIQKDTLNAVAYYKQTLLLDKNFTLARQKLSNYQSQ